MAEDREYCDGREMVREKRADGRKGACINEKLGKCRGCAKKFIEDLAKEGFIGVCIDEDGTMHEF